QRSQKQSAGQRPRCFLAGRSRLLEEDGSVTVKSAATPTPVVPSNLRFNKRKSNDDLTVTEPSSSRRRLRPAKKQRGLCPADCFCDRCIPVSSSDEDSDTGL